MPLGRTHDVDHSHVCQNEVVLFDFREADVGERSGLELFAHLGLEFVEVQNVDYFAGEVSQVEESLSLGTDNRFAAVELGPFCFDLVLGTDDVVHVPDLPVDGELIDEQFVVRVEEVHLGHVLNYFPQEVTIARFVHLIEDVLEIDLAILVEGDFEDNQLGSGKQGDEVVLDDGDQFS